MTEEVPFVPLFGRVLLKREKVEKIGSIIVPDSAQKRYAQEEGEVVAIGNTCEEFIKDLMGKKVLFARYSGDWIKVKDREWFICQEDDILGVIV